MGSDIVKAIELDIDKEVLVVLDDDIGKDCILHEVEAWLSEDCEYINISRSTMSLEDFDELSDC